MSTTATINLALTIIAIIVWIWWVIKNSSEWQYSVLAFVYLLNCVGLYITNWQHWLTPSQINDWSNMIRTYTLIVAICAPFIFRPKSKQNGS